MAFNTDRVTCHVSETLDAATGTKTTGAAGRDNTDHLQRGTQEFTYEAARSPYGDAVLAAGSRNQRLANEQWDTHDQMHGSVTNGVHSLVNARDSAIARMGG
ncbi:hypothetical protein GCM10027598_48520 [Amycolatopsis oliviviridis]|uniref:Uncharacterized protein n=1 Tax=Amycolatopsis oliviviridis TaxID=1471590 RepID=A0ABQ3M746_9PSEU|nr:hypothetical protein [Amycolatopsis oliviviridis]GHH30863.1 hypothetical protein GCM10017790_65010 [Amycolatopsis oliviviridis]